MTREELLRPFDPDADLSAWDLAPLILDGKAIGSLLLQGMEVHFALFPGETPKASVRKAVRDMLAPAFSRFDMLTTRVPKGMSAEREFVLRVGFSYSWSDADFEYFVLTQLPWERKPKEV
jgi:hypothetical protein